METSIKKPEMQVVELRKYSSQLDAEIAKGILNSAGIECEINDYIMDTLYPIEAIKSDSIRLLVNQKDADLANKILDAKFVKEDEGKI